MRLTDQENLAESGIDIVCSPPGKRLQNVLLLSGGEKALAAFALLIAIFKYQPSPFCVMDEVDAPLDESNINRLTKLLKEMADHTQFVVITHSKRTMEAAQALYGATMPFRWWNWGFPGQTIPLCGMRPSGRRGFSSRSTLTSPTCSCSPQARLRGLCGTPPATTSPALRGRLRRVQLH